MKYNILKKYAQDNLILRFVRGWKDSDGNISAVFDVSGKKYGFFKLSSSNDWHYWMGIGSDKITSQMPAGRGDYFIGTALEPEISKKLSEGIEGGAILEPLNTSGASWAPANESQLQALSNLINQAKIINDYLSQNGLLYTGDDKIIFGEKITGQDVLSFDINNNDKKTDIGIRSKENESQERATGNTPSTEKFIEEIKKSYKENFGKELYIGSTFRTPLDQARAMRDPLSVGDYDSLYGRGAKATEIKRLISTKNDDDLKRAAEIVATMGSSSHMGGRGIDIPFAKNNFSSRDYDSFYRFISKVSQITGISAKLNSEKKTHFHITVSS
jgi:hypothetical protein